MEFSVVVFCVADLLKSKVPPSLDDLCGYYSWMMNCSGYPDRYDHHGPDVERNATRGLTLHTSQKPATLASVHGTVDFTGIVTATDVGGVAGWTLAEKECNDSDEDTFDDEDQPLTITVMSVKDDKGHPFVRVTWKQSYDCDFYVIGKRQKMEFKSRRSKTGGRSWTYRTRRERLREVGEEDPEPPSDSE